MTIRFSGAAERDLEDIGDWIALDNPARAVSFTEELRDRCRSLNTQPQRFPVVSRVGDVSIRKLSHGSYLIFYRIASKSVEIMRVVHGARDWASLFTDPE